MLLKFHAKADALQRVPSFVPAVGQQDRYVGRFHDAARPGSFPASDEPFVCDSESADGQRLKHLIFRDGDLWAADQATADFCQVPFVAIELTDGEWVAKPPALEPQPDEGDAEIEITEELPDAEAAPAAAVAR